MSFGPDVKSDSWLKIIDRELKSTDVAVQTTARRMFNFHMWPLEGYRGVTINRTDTPDGQTEVFKLQLIATEREVAQAPEDLQLLFNDLRIDEALRVDLHARSNGFFRLVAVPQQDGYGFRLGAPHAGVRLVQRGTDPQRMAPVDDYNKEVARLTEGYRILNEGVAKERTWIGRGEALEYRFTAFPYLGRIYKASERWMGQVLRGRAP
jgi:hypothetical protein